jgi:hypothetical protein
MIRVVFHTHGLAMGRLCTYNGGGDQIILRIYGPEVAKCKGMVERGIFDRSPQVEDLESAFEIFFHFLSWYVLANTVFCSCGRLVDVGDKDGRTLVGFFLVLVLVMLSNSCIRYGNARCSTQSIQQETEDAYCGRRGLLCLHR